MAKRGRPKSSSPHAQSPMGHLLFTPQRVEGVATMIAPQPGPQTEILLRPEFEIGVGGGRGGGKSYGGYFWLMKGNPTEPQDLQRSPWNISYTMHSGYRALILRRNLVDLHDWVAGAQRFYDQLGEGIRPTYLKTERVFEWPSGAVFIVSHLDDKDSYLKYRGHQYQRLLLEEASLIPDENVYIEVLTAIRSTYPELKPQAMTNTNPDGPGLAWYKARFIVDPVTGKQRPFNVPFKVPSRMADGSVVELSRVFVPMLLKDNPALQKSDPLYLARLEAMPSEAKRRAYIYGDWDAMNGGVYFEEFRRDPQPHDPPEAYHCVKSSEVRLEDWFSQWWSMDWGFDHPAVFLRFVRHEEEERLYCTDELRFRRVPTRSMGEAWAIRAFQGVGRDRTITLWVSHDMFRKYTPGEPSGESDLELLMSGIESVLGPGTVQILEDKTPMEELELRQGTLVILRKAPSQRVPGWGLVVDLLSWQGLLRKPAEYNHEYALRLAAEDSIKYIEYMSVVREGRQVPKGLPKLRFFSDKVPNVIKGIERAVRDEGGEDVMKQDANSETGEGGDDEIDALRYGVAGWARSAAEVPREVMLRRKVQELERRRGERFSVGELVQVAERLDREIEMQERGKGSGYYVPRGSRGRMLEEEEGRK